MFRVVVVVLALVACTLAVTDYCYNRNGCVYTTGNKASDTKSFKSPFAWGEISEHCLNGRQQSPINFRQADIIYRPDFDQIVLDYKDLEEPKEPSHAGATTTSFPSGLGDAPIWAWSPSPRTTLWKADAIDGLEVYRRGSPNGIEMKIPNDKRDQFHMSGGPLPEPSYSLEEIIFRLPAEHQVEGVTHSMEVQFVHSAVDSEGITQYAILAVLFQVGEKDSQWLKQFTDRPEPTTRSYVKGALNFQNPKFGHATAKDAEKEVVCPRGRLCAVVDDKRAVGTVRTVEQYNGGKQLFEFQPVSKIESRVLLKGSAFRVIRKLAANELGSYISIEDAVLAETWRYGGDDPIRFADLLLGSEAPNDPREIVPFRFYKGSLSHPPCSENAWWVVTAVPQEMSVYQLGVFKKILGELPNNRPVQNTNKRPVYSTWYKDDKNYNDVQYDLNFERLFQVDK